MSDLYTLMCKDVPVCTMHYNPAIGVIEDVVAELNPAWCPPTAFDGTHIDARYLGYWWMGRLVPAGRLPRYLQQRPLFARLFTDNWGLSLSDQYWIRSAGDIETTWGAVNFFENDFDEVVGRELLGTCNRSSLWPGERMDNPSFWSNGMLRKYWRVGPGGVRQLCKSSSPARRREALNEFAVSEGLRCLVPGGGFVRYALEDGARGPWSVCDCFTDASHEYVPAAGAFFGDTLAYGPDAYGQILAFAEKHDIPGVREGLDRMMFVDCLTGNTDRHFGNFGFVRNVDTLTYERLAPIFDCGTSLWCDPDAALFAPFAENLNYQADLIEDASWVKWEAVERATDAMVAALEEHGTSAEETERVRDHLQAQVAVLQDAL